MTHRGSATQSIFSNFAENVQKCLESTFLGFLITENTISTQKLPLELELVGINWNL